MVTQILFILLFIIILCKPTCFLHRDSDEMVGGYKGALIEALFYYVFDKHNTIIISHKKFNEYWEKAEEQKTK